MKIAFVGSRTFKDTEWDDDSLICRIVRETFCDPVYRDREFVSGGAKGVDSIAEKYARGHGVKCHIFLPDWEQYGKSAGFIRNKLIIDAADKVIAFWDGKSKGTKSSIDLAINAGKPVDVYIRTGAVGS